MAIGSWVVFHCNLYDLSTIKRPDIRKAWKRLLPGQRLKEWSKEKEKGKPEVKKGPGILKKDLLHADQKL